ncbi:MAG: sensor histidine kinase [Clostridium sp.]|uniref:sensor histidine kinase n=1 Tax=Clostridium sp. TaxID=1506 RepID=UPI003D6C7ED3
MATIDNKIEDDIKALKSVDKVYKVCYLYFFSKRVAFLLNNQNQLEKMNWLIKNLLKLAKLDAKAIEIMKEKQSLNETMQDAIDALERKVFIIFKENGEIGFKHDRLWLEEALINIIKNGIEHTPGGGTINLELQENQLYTRIIIEDKGEGRTPIYYYIC